MAVDWLAIKAEYISTNISTRKLAEKHGVSASSMMKKASAEKWMDERKKQGSKIEAKLKQKTASKIASTEADRILTLLSISDKLARRIDQAASEDVDSQDILRLTSALKNIRDVAQTGKDNDSGKEIEDLSPIASMIAKGGVDCD